MRISNEDLLSESGSVALAGNASLRPIWLGHIAQYAIQLFFTGSPVGSFKLQCSNDAGHPNAQAKAEQSQDVVNWTDIAGSAAAVSAAGDVTWNAENVGYTWVRVVWTVTSGSGSITSARANMKGV